MKVPATLRAAGLIKKREFRKSLKTTSYEEARRLARVASVAIDTEISSAHRSLSPAPLRQITRSEVEHIALEWFWKSDAMRLQAATLRDGGTDETSRLGEALYIKGALLNPQDDLCRMNVQSELNRACKELGFDINPKSAAFEPLFELIRRGMLEQARRTIRAEHNDYSAIPGDEFYDRKALSSVRRTVTLEALLDAYANEPSRKGLGVKTLLKVKAQDRIFIEIFGRETDVANITRQDAARLVDLLKKLPANALKRYPGKTSEQACQLALEAGVAPMTRLTASTYLAAFQARMSYAVDNGWRQDNPADRLSVGKDGTNLRDKRQPFSTAQLKLIFNAPLYCGCIDDERGYARPGPHVIRRGRFWIPLVSLFTGMRMQEICQLFTSDVTKLDGVEVIMVEADDDGIKRIKTAAGKRFVPVHPELVRIGFLRYRDEMVQAGTKQLFPELNPSKSTGYFSDTFSKRFATFLKSSGAKKPKTAFHSFRHCYRDALRRTDITPERVDALGGWSSGLTKDDYGSGFEASTLAIEIEKVVYPELDLKHLYVPA